MNTYQLTPMLKVLDGFISEAECAHLIDLARPRLATAEVSGAAGAQRSDGRNNSMCWIEHEASSVVYGLIQRLAALVRLPMHHAESLQVVHYNNGEYYSPHYDAYDISTELGQRYVGASGNRLISVIGYLNTVTDGGTTGFPRLQLQIGAVAGRITVFDNCVPGTNQVNPDSLHEGCAVGSGEKWAFNLWFRERPYQAVSSTPLIIQDINKNPSIKQKYRYSAESQLLSSDPHVEIIDDLLTAQECEQIIEAARRHMKQALVSEGEGNGLVSDTRTGRVHWFAHAESPVIASVTARLSAMVGIPLQRAEPLQVIHYGLTQEYRAHFDGYDLATETGKRFTTQGGQRVLTALCYLNDVEQGGGTGFPKLDAEVAAKRGRVVIFQNCLAGTNTIHPLSLHAGLPIEQGEKWACNLWFRERAYY